MVPAFVFGQQSTQQIATPPGIVTPAAPPAATPSPPGAVASAPQPRVDSGDNAWMLTSSALVLMMTIPGLFLFYGGLVRGKNVLGTIMQSFIIVALYKYSVGPLGLYSRLRTRRRWNRWKSRLVGPERSRHGTERRLCCYDSPSNFYGLSDDVCGHYSRADHRGLCGTREIWGLPVFHSAMGNIHL